MENSKGEQKGPEEPSYGHYEETGTDLFNVPSRPVNEKSFASDLVLGPQALYQTAQSEKGGFSEGRPECFEDAENLA